MNGIIQFLRKHLCCFTTVSICCVHELGEKNFSEVNSVLSRYVKSKFFDCQVSRDSF